MGAGEPLCDREAEEREAERREADAEPFTAAELEPEEPVREHREEHEAAGDHRLDE